ncbi:MAG: deoxyguanosinetriphosphate triphosphohydrolase, partial [Verrucomicrobia bacterium]|nr:deoxyguanosinetriphosphate triphosphohydrolase [Verrucomicrobiota bacterium]
PQAPRGGAAYKHASLEAQVANLADEITYYSHDLDDGLDSGLLNEAELNQHVRIWAAAARRVKRAHGKLPDECRRYFIIRCLIDGQVEDVVATTEQNIARAGVQSADEVRLHPRPLVQYSPERRRLNQEMRKYLYQNLYFSREVDEANTRAVRLLEELFRHYLAHPADIGGKSRRRMTKVGLHRAVCDYLAGMTDRYAMQEHQRLFGLPR